MNQALVIIENEVPLADSRVIAENLGIAHRSLMQLIRDYQSEIEKHFGKVRFENAPSGKTKQLQRYALLTEPQTYYVLRLGENTPKSLEVNAQFIKAFMEMKAEIIPILQQEITQLRAQITLRLPEQVESFKQAITELDRLQAFVKEAPSADNFSYRTRSNLEFCLKKAQAYFQGGRVRYFDLNDKADEYGNIHPHEYPPD